VKADREHVIMLSDHSRMHPQRLYTKLKQDPGYFNYQRQTLAGLFAGKDQTLKPTGSPGARCGWTRPTFRT
jgi:hypothetical protein